MAGIFICKSGILLIRTAIPYDDMVNNKHIQKYYKEVIDSITKIDDRITEVRMKPESLSTKYMRKRTIAQWLILDTVERETKLTGALREC